MKRLISITGILCFLSLSAWASEVQINNAGIQNAQINIPQPTCYASGNPQSTSWGANLYGCTGSTSRCVNGTCRTCGGYIASDGCSGCAGQGGNGCWYAAAQDTSCTATCASHGSCSRTNWNDDASGTIGRYFFNCPSGAGGAGMSYNPVYWPPSYGNQCQVRTSGNQDCDAYYPGGMTHCNRYCVCEY